MGKIEKWLIETSWYAHRQFKTGLSKSLMGCLVSVLKHNCKRKS